MKTEQAIEAIIQHRGNLTAAARALGVGRPRLYRAARAQPTIQAAIDEARERMLDDAESVLYSKVLEGSTPELLFFLKTQGRARGYSERAEVEHSGTIGTYMVNIGDPDDSADE